MPSVINDWITSTEEIVGINVSGLIYKHPDNAKNSYGFVLDYNALIVRFIDWLLKNSDVKIVLISHVMNKPGHYESDYEACEDIINKLGDDSRRRLVASPCELDESQAKWLISQLDWFCGTRMHSTIAGLSSGVPTAAISYSDKTQGVFDTVGQGGEVIDPRIKDIDSALEALQSSFKRKDYIRKNLSNNVNRIKTQVDEQMKLIANNIDD